MRLRYALTALILLAALAAANAAQPAPFDTDELGAMALSRPGGPVGDIAFAHTGDIYTVTVDGKRFRRLTNDGRNAFPVWSHDGKRIAFTKANLTGRDWASAEIWVATADGKYSHPVTKPRNLHAVYPLTWMPDDSGIVATCMYLDSDVSPTLELAMCDGESCPLMRQWMDTSRKAKFIQQFNAGPVLFTPGQAGDVSSDGKWMIFTAATTWLVDAPQLDIYRMNPDGSNLKRLAELPDSVVYCLRWNDHTNQVLSVEEYWTREPRVAGVWLRDGNGRPLKKLADMETPGYNSADWSPNGRQIIYSQTDGKYLDWHPSAFEEMSSHASLWIMNADGSGKYRLAEDACTPSWR